MFWFSAELLIRISGGLAVRRLRIESDTAGLNAGKPEA